MKNTLLNNKLFYNAFAHLKLGQLKKTRVFISNKINQLKIVIIKTSGSTLNVLR